MKAKLGLVSFIAGFITCAALVAILMSFSQFVRYEPKPPTIAGQSVPEHRYQIDFDHRYDLILDSYRGERLLEDCLVRGFTEEVTESGGPRSSRGYGYFDSWLVVELPDGRLAYLPPRSIHIIEEAKTPNEALHDAASDRTDAAPSRP